MQTVQVFLQWRLKCAAEYFVSVLLMSTGCFYTGSPSKTCEDRNPVAVDRRSRRPQVSGNIAATRNWLNICIVQFALAPSCWNLRSGSSKFKREMRFIFSSWQRSAVIVVLRKWYQSPSVETAHRTATSKEPNGFHGRCAGLSAPYSAVVATCVST